MMAVSGFFRLWKNRNDSIETVSTRKEELWWKFVNIIYWLVKAKNNKTVYRRRATIETFSTLTICHNSLVSNKKLTTANISSSRDLLNGIFMVLNLWDDEEWGRTSQLIISNCTHELLSLADFQISFKIIGFWFRFILQASGCQLTAWWEKSTSNEDEKWFYFLRKLSLFFLKFEID